MEFFLFILAFYFFIFLFYLHFLVKEDFVFIRKNISLEQLFNIAFVTGFAALFGSRLFYVFYNPSFQYLNPLAFFALPYFPGLSISGALIGAALALVFYGRKKKVPSSRIADFFSISFLCVVSIGFFITSLMVPKNEFLLFIIAGVLSSILYGVFIRFLFPKFISGQFKDGTITYLFFMNFSLVFLLSHIISRASLRQFYFLPEDGVLLVPFIVGCILYVRQEHGFLKKKSIRPQL